MFPKDKLLCKKIIYILHTSLETSYINRGNIIGDFSNKCALRIGQNPFSYDVAIARGNENFV